LRDWPFFGARGSSIALSGPTEFIIDNGGFCVSKPAPIRTRDPYESASSFPAAHLATIEPASSLPSDLFCMNLESDQSALDPPRCADRLLRSEAVRSAGPPVECIRSAQRPDAV
jgi:hypothetical protein